MASELVCGEQIILAAWSNGSNGGARVGVENVTRIDAYYEPGQMAAVPWLRVWKGGALAARLNAAAMTMIEYKYE